MDYLENLNDKQRQAVLHTGSPLLILAGAGSGKTTVITRKIAYMVDSLGCNPYSILAVTFTNKAAREMKERAIKLCPTCESVMLKTFHAFGAWLLRRYSDTIGLNNGFSILDGDDALVLMVNTFPEIPKSELKLYSQMISRAKDYMLYPGDDLSSVSDDPMLETIYSGYQKKLKSTNCVDFGDLIGLSVLLLKENVDVQRYVSRRFDVVMVDEYQDSNVAQYELLKVLCHEDTYLCVVGDDDQSIYKFRGAEVQNIVNFPNEFQNTEVIRLEQNYRSHNSILVAASGVISNNSNRLGKVLWTDRDDDQKVEVHHLENFEDEAYLCAKILQKDKDYANSAVLYRTNAQSVTFETVFSKLKIPFTVVGALRFYARAEVKDVLAYLSLIINPYNEVGFRRIINKPARSVGKISVDKIVAKSLDENVTLFEAAYQFATDSKKKQLKEFCEIYLAAVNNLESVSVSSLIHIYINDSGLRDFYKKEDDLSGGSRENNLSELMNIASDYSSGIAGLASFLEDLSLDSTMGVPETAEDGVTLITMHNTKGLEFDRVFVTGLEETVFPSSKSISTDDVEEERRIMYVALTRARNSLILTSVSKRRIWGQYHVLEPSRFLKEVPEEVIEEFGVSGVLDTKYKPGVYVFHDDYGTGVIIKQTHNGDQEIVIVKFETGFQGQFLTKYTQLEIVDGF